MLCFDRWRWEYVLAHRLRVGFVPVEAAADAAPIRPLALAAAIVTPPGRAGAQPIAIVGGPTDPASGPVIENGTVVIDGADHGSGRDGARPVGRASLTREGSG